MPPQLKVAEPCVCGAGMAGRFWAGRGVAMAESTTAAVPRTGDMRRMGISFAAASRQVNSGKSTRPAPSLRPPRTTYVLMAGSQSRELGPYVKVPLAVEDAADCRARHRGRMEFERPGR